MPNVIFGGGKGGHASSPGVWAEWLWQVIY
jgi:hypothetical protein